LGTDYDRFGAVSRDDFAIMPPVFSVSSFPQYPEKKRGIEFFHTTLSYVFTAFSAIASESSYCAPKTSETGKKQNVNSIGGIQSLPVAEVTIVPVYHPLFVGCEESRDNTVCFFFASFLPVGKEMNGIEVEYRDAVSFSEVFGER